MARSKPHSLGHWARAGRGRLRFRVKEKCGRLRRFRDARPLPSNLPVTTPFSTALSALTLQTSKVLLTQIGLA